METEQPLSPLFTCEKTGMLGVESDWQSRFTLNPQRIGAALENLGNTCFLNAVLQCITHTVPLVQSLRSSTAHTAPCSRSGFVGGGEGGFCSLCALRQHVEICLSESGRVVEPHGFATNLGKISSSFRRYQQEDAHEFLHCLLDSLHSGCLDPDFSDSLHYLQENSFIKQIFGGRLRSQVRCCECGHCSDTFEPLLDLSLEIEDADSLQEALESFTKVEKIEDPEIKFTCEGCKARVSVQKQFTLDQAPQVVALHLKRFMSNGYYTDKIGKFVYYPRELDLKPYLSAPDDEGELKYELYALVVHQGGASLYGHYYCFIRSSPDVWHEMDDEKVTRVCEDFALSQSAYILFYMKKGLPWFSNLMEQQKINTDLNNGNKTSPISVLDHAESCYNLSSDVESNCNNSMETPKKDEDLNICGDASPDSVMDDAERDHVLCPPEARNRGIIDAEGDQTKGAVDICVATPPRIPYSPKRQAMNKFYDDPWEEDEKDKFQKPLIHREVGKSANKAERGLVDGALHSYMRSMPSSRRNSFQRYMPSTYQPTAEPHKRKRRMSFDSENIPHTSSMTTSVTPASSQSFLSGLSLHDLVAKEDPHLVLEFCSNQSDQRKK